MLGGTAKLVNMAAISPTLSNFEFILFFFDRKGTPRSCVKPPSSFRRFFIAFYFLVLPYVWALFFLKVVRLPVDRVRGWGACSWFEWIRFFL